MIDSVVIVGAGHAGVSLAFKLRALGCVGQITLISDEPDIPYQRPPLSKKYLMGTVDADRMHIKNQSLYEREGIDLRLNCKVSAIQRDERYVDLADGRQLRYDKLVLATGARARCLPTGPQTKSYGAAENIYTFRTLRDAVALRSEMIAGKNLLIIGGGYIGLETAAVARSLGMHVTLIERDSRILGRVASTETADYFRSLHSENGVEIREAATLHELSCVGNRVVAARLNDGTVIDTDAVVVGVGVIVETGLAEQAGLTLDNGIVVDEQGRTADPSIYAIGDCASFPYQDRLIRLESVQNAVDMAEVVARSMMGTWVEYRPVPWFWSDQYATKLQIAGLNQGYSHVVIRRQSDEAFSIWYYKDRQLLAVDAINDAKAFMTAKRWIGEGVSPLDDEIGDVSVALSAISPSPVTAQMR